MAGNGQNAGMNGDMMVIWWVNCEFMVFNSVSIAMMVSDCDIWLMVIRPGW